MLFYIDKSYTICLQLHSIQTHFSFLSNLVLTLSARMLCLLKPPLQHKIMEITFRCIWISWVIYAFLDLYASECYSYQSYDYHCTSNKSFSAFGLFVLLSWGGIILYNAYQMLCLFKLSNHLLTNNSYMYSITCSFLRLCILIHVTYIYLTFAVISVSHAYTKYYGQYSLIYSSTSFSEAMQAKGVWFVTLFCSYTAVNVGNAISQLTDAIYTNSMIDVGNVSFILFYSRPIHLILFIFYIVEFNIHKHQMLDFFVGQTSNLGYHDPPSVHGCRFVHIFFNSSEIAFCVLNLITFIFCNHFVSATEKSISHIHDLNKKYIPYKQNHVKLGIRSKWSKNKFWIQNLMVIGSCTLTFVTTITHVQNIQQATKPVGNFASGADGIIEFICESAIVTAIVSAVSILTSYCKCKCCCCCTNLIPSDNKFRLLCITKTVLLLSKQLLIQELTDDFDWISVVFTILSFISWSTIAVITYAIDSKFVLALRHLKYPKLFHFTYVISYLVTSTGSLLVILAGFALKHSASSSDLYWQYIVLLPFIWLFFGKLYNNEFTRLKTSIKSDRNNMYNQGMPVTVDSVYQFQWLVILSSIITFILFYEYQDDFDTIKKHPTHYSHSDVKWYHVFYNFQMVLSCITFINGFLTLFSLQKKGSISIIQQPFLIQRNVELFIEEEDKVVSLLQDEDELEIEQGQFRNKFSIGANGQDLDFNDSDFEDSGKQESD